MEIIISVTERILAASQTIWSGTERSLSVTERIVAVTAMIICGMEKTVSPTDFIPDAMEIIFVKSSGIADETEIITDEASINRSGLEMIEAISRSIDGLLCAVAFMTRLYGTPCSIPNGMSVCLFFNGLSERGLCKRSLLGDCRFWATGFINCLKKFEQLVLHCSAVEDWKPLPLRGRIPSLAIKKESCRTVR